MAERRTVSNPNYRPATVSGTDAVDLRAAVIDAIAIDRNRLIDIDAIIDATKPGNAYTEADRDWIMEKVRDLLEP